MSYVVIISAYPGILAADIVVAVIAATSLAGCVAVICILVVVAVAASRLALLLRGRGPLALAGPLVVQVFMTAFFVVVCNPVGLLLLRSAGLFCPFADGRGLHSHLEQVVISALVARWAVG